MICHMCTARIQVKNRNIYFCSNITSPDLYNENSYTNFENRILQIHHHKTIENLGANDAFDVRITIN